MKLVPEFLRRRRRETGGLEFVPRRRRRSSHSPDASCEDVQKMQASRNGPAAKISGTRRAPVVTGEPSPGASDLSRYIDDRRGRHATFFLGEFRCVFFIEL